MAQNLTLEQEIHEVTRLREEKGFTYEEIGEQLGFSEKTARRRAAATAIVEAAATLAGEDTLKDFPESPLAEVKIKGAFLPEDRNAIERFEPLTRYGDAMVTCDWHIPLHDPSLINTMVEVARTNKIKKLIIGGDYFHMEEFSSFLPYQPEASLEQERYDGNFIMKTLLETFNEVDIFWGNHDFRLTKKLGYKKSFEETIDWMLEGLTKKERSKIRISSLDYMHYYPEGPDGRKFRICHPRNFSSVPLTVPRKLAEKYSCSVITAHSHHCAMGAAPNGVDLVIDGGGFFHKQRTEYIQKSTANHEWVPGYTMFKDGVPTLYSPILGNLPTPKGVKK